MPYLIDVKTKAKQHEEKHCSIFRHMAGAGGTQPARVKCSHFILIGCQQTVQSNWHLLYFSRQTALLGDVNQARSRLWRNHPELLNLKPSNASHTLTQAYSRYTQNTPLQQQTNITYNVNQILTVIIHTLVKKVLEFTRSNKESNSHIQYKESSKTCLLLVFFIVFFPLNKVILGAKSWPSHWY